MNERIRYEHTYFIYQFQIDNMKQYITNLLENKNIYINLFEKEKDIDLYSYFSKQAKELFFPSFQFKKEQISKIEKMTKKQKIKFFLKQEAFYAEYNTKQAIPAKLGEKDGTFFTIEKIEIICFSTGIGFLTMKTQLEDAKQIMQILDFNYQFKNIISGQADKNTCQDIKIQTNYFENASQIIELINSITMQNKNKKEIFLYSYVCIASEDWKNKEDFQKIKLKYKNLVNAKPSNEKTMEGKSIYETNYIHVGISKSGMGVVASSKEIFNYTKLPYYLERQYLYTLIIGLYKRKINEKTNFKKQININITNDKLGIKILKQMDKQFKIKDNRIKEKRNNKLNNILLSILLILLVFSLWILLKIING